MSNILFEFALLKIYLFYCVYINTTPIYFAFIFHKLISYKSIIIPIIYENTTPFTFNRSIISKKVILSQNILSLLNKNCPTIIYRFIVFKFTRRIINAYHTIQIYSPTELSFIPHKIAFFNVYLRTLNYFQSPSLKYCLII